MKLRVLNENVADEARALRDYVYEEAQNAGFSATKEYGRPLTKEDRQEAYRTYINSDSFRTWWENVISKRASEVASFGLDAQELFKNVKFDLNEAAKTGFYSGFGD